MNEPIATTEAAKPQTVVQAARSRGNRFRDFKFQIIGYGLLLIVGLIAPFVGYPVFLMQALCFALFACAFNLLLGYTGLLSFGHAAFFSICLFWKYYAL